MGTTGVGHTLPLTLPTGAPTAHRNRRQADDVGPGATENDLPQRRPTMAVGRCSAGEQTEPARRRGKRRRLSTSKRPRSARPRHAARGGATACGVASPACRRSVRVRVRPAGAWTSLAGTTATTSFYLTVTLPGPEGTGPGTHGGGGDGGGGGDTAAAAEGRKTSFSSVHLPSSRGRLPDLGLTSPTHAESVDFGTCRRGVWPWWI